MSQNGPSGPYWLMVGNAGTHSNNGGSRNVIKTATISITDIEFLGSNNILLRILIMNVSTDIHQINIDCVKIDQLKRYPFIVQNVDWARIPESSVRKGLILIMATIPPSITDTFRYIINL